MGVERRHVVFVHPNAEIGGSDIALARSVEALDPRRVRASVILPAVGPLEERLRRAGAETHHVPMRMLRTLPSVSYQAAYLAAFPGTVARIARLLRRLGPDLVHTNSLYCLYGAFAARAAGVPHLWHVREIPPRVPVLRPAYGAMVRALSDHVLFMTKACARGLYDERPPRRSSVIFDGVDLAEWPPGGRDPGRIRADLSIPSKVPLVGFAARLDPWKGLPVFLEAMGRVAAARPDAHFLVAGGAPAGFEDHESACRQAAERLGIADRVRFAGWRYGPADMPDVMAALDVFCHTAIAPEPFGLVLLEAMATGTPLVAAAAGGPLEIVEDGVSGHLVPPGDASALSARVLALLSDRGGAAALARAARTRVETTFSSTAFAARLEDLYDRLARAPAGAAAARSAPAPSPAD